MDWSTIVIIALIIVLIIITAFVLTFETSHGWAWVMGIVAGAGVTLIYCFTGDNPKGGRGEELLEESVRDCGACGDGDENERGDNVITGEGEAVMGGHEYAIFLELGNFADKIGDEELKKKAESLCKISDEASREKKNGLREVIAYVKGVSNKGKKDEVNALIKEIEAKNEFINTYEKEHMQDYVKLNNELIEALKTAFA